MSASLDEILTFEESVVLAAEAAKVFRPRTPITSKELFAGRWNELKAVADAVNQPGLHSVIYGERGVGKTSLANVISPTIRVLDRSGKQESEVSERLIVKTVTTTGDSFSSIWTKLFGEVSMIDNRPTIGLIPNSRERIPLLDAYGLKQPLSIDDVRRIEERDSFS